MSVGFFVLLGTVVLMSFGLLFVIVAQEVTKGKQKDVERETYLRNLNKLMDKLMSRDYQTYAENLPYQLPDAANTTWDAGYPSNTTAINPPDGIR